MGCTSNIETFLARIKTAQDTLPAASRTAVNAAALACTTVMRAEINSATHGGVLRGVGRRGAKVGVGFLPAASMSHPVAKVSARGPLHLVERDNRAHQILPRRAKALSIGQGVFAASVQHPGSAGKHPFERSKPAGIAAARGAYEAALTAEFKKAIG